MSLYPFSTSSDHSYEEIDVNDPVNLNFGIYNVKKGQITSLVNHNFTRSSFTVNLEKNHIFENLNEHSNRPIKPKEKGSNMGIPLFDEGEDEKNPGSEQFMDVVSWLRSVHSEMRFDNLGFNDDECEMRLNHNFML